MAKVLYITYDGILEPLGQSQVLNYLEKLSKDHEITLMSFEKKQDTKNINYLNKTESRCRKSGIIWVSLIYHKSLFGTFYDIIKGIYKGLILKIRNKTEIVHARSYLPALISLVLKKTLGSKFIFDMRGLWADEKADSGTWKREGTLYKITKRLETIFLREADKIVSLTEAAVKEIKTFPALDPNRLEFEVIRTCTNLSLFKPSIRLSNSEKKPSFTLGYVGSISLWYLFDEVLQFFKILQERVPNSVLHITNRNEHKEIRNFLENYSFTNESIILESVQHHKVAHSMSSMDAGIFFIQTFYSKIASCPTKLGEFLALGLPCVTNSGVGDMTSIIEEKKTGVILSNFSKDSLSKGVDNLLTLKEDDELSKRCIESSEKYFSLDNGAKQYNKIYSSF